jgi:hypothetical protein
MVWFPRGGLSPMSGGVLVDGPRYRKGLSPRAAIPDIPTLALERTVDSLKVTVRSLPNATISLSVTATSRVVTKNRAPITRKPRAAQANSQDRTLTSLLVRTISVPPSTCLGNVLATSAAASGKRFHVAGNLRAYAAISRAVVGSLWKRTGRSLARPSVRFPRLVVSLPVRMSPVGCQIPLLRDAGCSRSCTARLGGVVFASLQASWRSFHNTSTSLPVTTTSFPVTAPSLPQTERRLHG